MDGRPGSAYFQQQKNGEVAELRQLLRSPAVAKDQALRRDVMRRVIGFMTMGVDMSSLFSDMVMATTTHDVVQKKMIFLFLCNYAESNAELALLAINTLQKDCHNADPMIRGLAMRSMCSLRLPNIVEYLFTPIERGLTDPSPYVRKTAVMGAAKLFHLAPERVQDSSLVDTLYDMLRDKDPIVVCNCIAALNEILTNQGGIAVNRQLIYYLLNRIRDFNEWGVCNVLELVAAFKPEEEDVVFDVMNLLDERLKHSNLAVVLGCVKVFLRYTDSLPHLQEQVYERLKAPLLTFMTGSSHELAYVCITHLEMIVQRMPAVFVPDYKTFYCRYNEPQNIKLVKLRILTQLATAATYAEIVGELSEYVTDVDATLAAAAITAIGEVAVRLPDEAGDFVVDGLMKLFDLDMDYVAARTMVVMKDLLRRFPHRHGDVLPAVGRALRTMENAEARCAILWMIGEYGDYIDEAPYILEPLIEGYADEQSTSVRLQLLTTTMQLFFKRPPEVHQMLGALLCEACGDESNQDVHDRALLYYRLLTRDHNEAARVVDSPKEPIEVFAEDEHNEIKARVFDEFNTLSVVYGIPSERFLTAVVERVSTSFDDDDDDDDDDADADADKGVAGGAGGGGVEEGGGVVDGAGGAAAVQPQGSLVELGATPAAAPPAAAGVALAPAPVLDPQAFQGKWQSLGVAATVNATLAHVPSGDVLEQRMLAAGVVCMASGLVGATMKHYFYAREAPAGAFFLVECIIDTTSGAMQATMKAETDVGAFRDMFTGLVQQ